MKIVQYVTGIFLGTFVFASLVSAQGMGGKAGKPMRPEVEYKLGLTPEQSNKLSTVRERIGDEIKVISVALKDKRLALSNELAALNPDRKKIDAIAVEVSQLTTQEITKHIEEVFSIRAILTPEQNQKYYDLLQAQMKASAGKKEEKRSSRKGQKGKKKAL